MNKMRISTLLMAGSLTVFSCAPGSLPTKESVSAALGNVSSSTGQPPAIKPPQTNSQTEPNKPLSTDGVVKGVVTASGFKIQQASVTVVVGATVKIEGTDKKTTTNNKGEFTLEGAPVGKKFAIVAEKPDVDGKDFKIRHVVQRIESTQKTLNLGSLALKQTGSLFGKISLAERADFTGTDVFIAGTSLSAKTDKDGNFALSDVAEGEYTVSAFKEGFLPQSSQVSVKVVAGKPTAVAGMVLQVDTAASRFGVLKGTIKGDSGPLAGATVSLFGTDLTQSHVAVTDEKGQYVIGRIEPNGSALMPEPQYKVVVDKAFYDTVVDVVSVKGGEKVTKDLELINQEVTLGRLNVKVEDCDGKPISSALVQLDPAPVFTTTPFTDNNGKFGFTQLFPGKYTVYGAKGEQKVFEGIVLGNAKTGKDGIVGDVKELSLKLGSCNALPPAPPPQTPPKEPPPPSPAPPMTPPSTLPTGSTNIAPFSTLPEGLKNGVVETPTSGNEAYSGTLDVGQTLKIDFDKTYKIDKVFIHAGCNDGETMDGNIRSANNTIIASFTNVGCNGPAISFPTVDTKGIQIEMTAIKGSPIISLYEIEIYGIPVPSAEPAFTSLDFSEFQRHWAAQTDPARNLVVDDPLNQKGKVLKVHGEHGWWATFCKPLPEKPRMLTAEAWMMAGGGDAGPWLSFRESISGASAVDIGRLGFDDRKSPPTVNGNPVQNNTWYKIRMVLDMNAGTWQGFLDEKPVGNGTVDKAKTANMFCLDAGQPGYFHDVKLQAK